MNFKENKEKVLESHQRTKSTSLTAREFGVPAKEIWRMLRLAGVHTRPVNKFTESDKEFLKLNYEKIVSSGGLRSLAKKMKRTPQFLSRQANKLGLTKKGRANTKESREKGAKSFKDWLSKNPHPKGMLGKKHSQETKDRLSITSKQTWKNMSEEKKNIISVNAAERSRRSKHLNGRSWKQSWQTIGGKKHFFRSNWEVNYARYLEFLKTKKMITDWEFEPEVFWFLEIKRGIRSYLPDFKVTLIDGSIEYHEVKGWMDSGSRTKIKRFRKYYPDRKLIVIDSKKYKKLKKAFGSQFI